MQNVIVLFKKLNQNQWLVALSILFALVVLSLLAFEIIHQSSTPPTAQQIPTNTNPPEAAKPTLDPITIEAIRERTYLASPIITEQKLGEQGGYTNAIISYHSDGFIIFALKSTPNGTSPLGGWPVIIFNHGYINPAQYQTNGADYQQFIAALARAGFVVIKPDYRGHGKSEGQPEGGHFSPVYAYDDLNLIASLKQFPGINPNRIGLVGHSLGGHVSLRTAVVSKDIKATALLAGVTGSFYDLLYNWPNGPMPLDQPMALVQGIKQTLIDKYSMPKDNPTFWDSASSVNYVSDTVGPVQVSHDQSDSVVPKLFSDHLVQALQNANKPVQYYVYPGDDHQFIKNRSLVLQRLVDFFKASL